MRSRHTRPALRLAVGRARLCNLALAGLLLVLCACVALPEASSHEPPERSREGKDVAGGKRTLAAVITSSEHGAALTPAARAMIVRAAAGRIATRIYLSSAVDPTKSLTLDKALVRRHIDQRAPSRQEGCLFVVDFEGDYYRALRSRDPQQVERAVNLFLDTVRAVKEARPGEPVMIYGLPNPNWSNFDFSTFDEVFAEVDYLNVSAYAGNDKTEERYRARIDRSVAISKRIADQFDLELLAHVNPRYKDQALVPMDQFIAGMQYLKSKGVKHVVYWQPPWPRISNLASDGKPAGMSDEAWHVAVEECYLCALLKVFDAENPVSKSCRTTLPNQRN